MKTLTRQLTVEATRHSYVVTARGGRHAAIDRSCLNAIIGAPVCDRGQIARCRVTIEVLEVKEGEERGGRSAAEKRCPEP